jgi:hypothetical protein
MVLILPNEPGVNIGKEVEIKHDWVNDWHLTW